MSYDWTSQPLSIQSIVERFPLPILIRSAPGFRGSDRPIVLYSIKRVLFAFGRALRTVQGDSNEHSTFRPIDSETVAIPLGYPGYFECLPSRHIKQQTGVVPDTAIPPIVQRMESEQRSHAFYIASPLRVYTIESEPNGTFRRLWHQIDANQMILFEKLETVQYLPTNEDNITDDDYGYSWWFCFGKHLINRNEYAVKCILSEGSICYIPCASTDEVKLIPVGQRGSSNVNKLQDIQNLIEQFQMPLNLKLAELPGLYAYQDFPGYLRLLGTRSEDFAICGSLSSSNIVVIPISTPLKFITASISQKSLEIKQVLSACQIFDQSFNMQIRRVLISSDHRTSTHRSRSRNSKKQELAEKTSSDFKQPYNITSKSSQHTEHNVTTDEGYRSNNTVTKRRHLGRRSRASSVDTEQRSQSTDEDPAYSAKKRMHHKKRNASVSSSTPPALPKKPPNYPYPTQLATNDLDGSVIDFFDHPVANGAMLMDISNELYQALPSDSRFT